MYVAMNQSTLAEFINKFQSQNLLARKLVQLIHWPRDPSIWTGLNYFGFLVFDTQKLMYILHTIQMYFLD